jgi:O-succinylbenzoate synthase
MAKATLEHAVWDCYARQQGVSLSKLLGGSNDAVPVGASLGMAPVPETVERVGRHLDEGYQRIKLKIEPGADVDVLAAVRAAYPDASLSADANSAYTLAEADHLRALDAVGLTYLEQPLHWDDLSEHAALAALVATPLCLDESLTSYERTVAALDAGACAVVNLKSARVGGHAVARRINDLCLGRAVPMWCGGMYELGVGRAHNIHLATLAGFTLPGDTASASRTYARDIVEEPLEASDGWMPVPAGPGIGVSLDRRFLERVTSSVEVQGRSRRVGRTP